MKPLILILAIIQSMIFGLIAYERANSYSVEGKSSRITSSNYDGDQQKTGRTDLHGGKVMNFAKLAAFIAVNIILGFLVFLILIRLGVRSSERTPIFSAFLFSPIIDYFFLAPLLHKSMVL